MAGAALLTVDLVWSFWLLVTMEMGEFASFRRPLLILLPIGFILVLRFVDEFLAVRALGILCLLAAEPLLDAAFLRPETSRLLVTVLAYLMIVAGLIWVTMPYLLRDQIQWSARSAERWWLLSGFGLRLRRGDSGLCVRGILSGSTLGAPTLARRTGSGRIRGKTIGSNLGDPRWRNWRLHPHVARDQSCCAIRFPPLTSRFSATNTSSRSPR